MVKNRSKFIRYAQVWALLLFFLGSWASAAFHHHEVQAKEHSDCATCHFQQQVRSSDLNPTLSIALPVQWLESIQIEQIDFQPSLQVFLTKKSQAPPQV